MILFPDEKRVKATRQDTLKRITVLKRYSLLANVSISYTIGDELLTKRTLAVGFATSPDRNFPDSNT